VSFAEDRRSDRKAAMKAALVQSPEFIELMLRCYLKHEVEVIYANRSYIGNRDHIEDEVLEDACDNYCARTPA
jgi:hypothetical protein